MSGRGIPRHVVALLLLIALSGFGQQTPESLVARAASLIEARNFSEASKLVSRSLQRYPDEEQLWNLLGISEGELGRSDSAHQAFEHGLQSSPNSISLHENLGFLYYREGNYAESKRYLNKAVSLGSKNPGVLFSLA